MKLEKVSSYSSSLPPSLSIYLSICLSVCLFVSLCLSLPFSLCLWICNMHTAPAQVFSSLRSTPKICVRQISLKRMVPHTSNPSRPSTQNSFAPIILILWRSQFTFSHLRSPDLRPKFRTNHLSDKFPFSNRSY